MARWHWAGDSGNFWAPHLNFFIEAGYIEKERLERWRNDYKGWIKRAFGVELKEVDIHYQYTESVPKKVYLLKYVTRATLTWFDPELVKIVKGFRSTMSWGKWDKVNKIDYKDLDDTELERIFKNEVTVMEDKELTYDEIQEYLTLSRLEKQRCPCCGGKINWVGIRPGSVPKDYTDIGGGYYVKVRKIKGGDTCIR